MSLRLSKLPLPELGILLLALFFRLYLLDIKPPHFDEGVNGWFADQMTERGFYHYDPSNYHGPLHMYAVFLSQTLFGRNIWALRAPAILASMLAIWMLLKHREFFGVTTVRIASLAMAVSPAFVFYGRYSIHESWQVFFSIAFLWGWLGLWDRGERKFLYAVILSSAGLVLTKETYFLHIGSFLLASLVLKFWEHVFPSTPHLPWAKQTWTEADLIRVTLVGLFLIVFFYSGNFLDFPGLAGLYQTFAAWFQTGIDTGGHKKEFYYWVTLMARYEWPALLGLAACVRYAFPSAPRIRLVAIYGCGALLAYSIIPYKTPWCIISILWPFLLVFGAIFDELARKIPSPLPAWGAATAVVLASLYPSVRLNFFDYTNEKEPYVYVQTHKDVATLMRPLVEMARRDPRNYHVSGYILTESYYPLPWMLGDFPQVAYYGKTTPPDYNADFIVIESSRASTVLPHLEEKYFQRPFRLRDAQEECTVFFREKTFAPWFEENPAKP